MSNHDKDLITLKCQDCGENFQLTFGRYRRCSPYTFWRCKKCQNIHRKVQFANLNDKQRQQLHDQRVMSAKKTWKELTVDEYMRRCISQQERWSKLPKEEKDRLLRNMREAQLEYARSPETKAALAQRNREHWSMLSEEERKKELERLNWIRDNYWNSLSEEEQFLKMYKMWSANTGGIGPTEYIFNDALISMGMKNGKDYYWSYNTYPFIDHRFYDVFGKINSITGEDNIPYHSWDFIIFPGSDNPWLIDIDGSVHDPHYMHFKRNGNDYTDRQKIDYNDAKREYQIPDGMTPIIIQAWKNKLDDNVPVVNLTNKVRFSYIRLVNLINSRFQGLLIDNSSQKLIDYRTTTDTEHTVPM